MDSTIVDLQWPVQSQVIDNQVSKDFDESNKAKGNAIISDAPKYNPLHKRFAKECLSLLIYLVAIFFVKVVVLYLNYMVSRVI